MRGLIYSLVLIALTVLIGFGTGCNTVRGAGKDIQVMGHAVEHAFDKK